MIRLAAPPGRRSSLVLTLGRLLESLGHFNDGEEASLFLLKTVKGLGDDMLRKPESGADFDPVPSTLG